MRSQKDSIERFKQKRVEDISRQSKYLQEQLTASLPKFYEQNFEQELLSTPVSSKKLSIRESPMKQRSRGEDSPLKLKKTFSKKSSLSPTKTTTTSSNSPKKLYQSKQSLKKNPQTILQDHPYSIIKKLQKMQREKPDEEKKIFKYRQIHSIKQYTLEEVDEMIEQLMQKVSYMENERLSVTDQFILFNHIDLKIKRVYEKAKAEQKAAKLRAPPVYNCTCVPSHNNPDKNEQLLKALSEIKFVWDLYQIKMTHCPDILANNPDTQLISEKIKHLFRQLTQLEDQRKKHQLNSPVTPLTQKWGKKIVEPNNEVIVKKIKAIMKKFKEIITPPQK